jgi:hypothetical protein
MNKLKVKAIKAAEMNSAGTVFVNIFRHILTLAIPDTYNVNEYQTVNRGK